MPIRNTLICFLKRRGFLILSFLLPVVLLTGIYASMRLFPLGHRSILVVDLNAQYVDFYAALRRMIFEGASPFYSWGLMLGGNMLGIISYYLSSPFSIFALLFPEKYLLEALLWITMAKIGCAGLSMAIFLQQSFQARGLKLLLFSTPYALMAYVGMYSYNIMWLDGLIFLPLIALGVEAIVRQGRFGLYLISLTLMMLANYYIGLMLAIFAGLYFFYQSALYFDHGTGHQFLKRLGIFVLASLWSLGLGAFLFLPTYYTLATGKLAFDPANLTLTPKFSLLDLPAKLLFGSYDSALVSLPNIYCGLLMVLLAGIFFFQPGISRRKKIAAAVILAALIANFYLNGLDVIWHGFQTPKGFPYRYSFVFSFLILCLAYQAAYQAQDNRQGIPVKALLISFVMGLGAVIWTKFHGIAYMSNLTLLVSLLLICTYASLLYLQSRYPRLSGPLMLLLTLTVVLEAGLNTWYCFRKTNQEFQYKDRASYWSAVGQVQPILDGLRQQDADFYRVEKTFTRSYNDAINLGYAGITHFSSSFSRPTLTFLKEMGFFQPFYRLLYTGQTLPLDSILGVKYLLAKEPITNPYPVINQSQAGSETITTYQNPYALPLGFMVSPELSQVHIGQNRPLYWQDQMVQAMTGLGSAAYFNPLETQVSSLYNVAVQADDQGWLHYTTQDLNAEGSIELRFKAATADPIYAFLIAQDNSKMHVSLNGRFLGYYGENSENNNILLLGQYAPGTEVSLQIKLMNGQATLANEPLVYQLDLARFAQAYQDLSANSLKITRFSDTQVIGSVSAAPGKTLLFTSIPYDQGWTVRLDGKVVDIVRLLDTFIGVTLPEGDHSIEFSYFPPGLWAGCAISAASLLLAVVLLVFKKRLLAWIRND